MKKSGSSFGLILLVVVTAVVLLLAASAWKRAAAPALEAAGDTAREALAPTPAAASETPTDRSQRPGIREMRDETTRHADRLGEALETID